MFCPFCREILQGLFQFCPFCGSKPPKAANRPEQDVEPAFLGHKISCEESISRYFRQGFVDEKILLFVSNYHGIQHLRSHSV